MTKNQVIIYELYETKKRLNQRLLTLTAKVAIRQTKKAKSDINQLINGLMAKTI